MLVWLGPTLSIDSLYRDSYLGRHWWRRERVSKVGLYENIRLARRDAGLSVRKLAVRFRVHRREVRLAVNGDGPSPRAVSARRTRPVSGPWREWIRQVLIDDGDAPRKQRHTAKRIWERLAAEHDVKISLSRVRSVVAELRAELAAVDVSAVIEPKNGILHNNWAFCMLPRDPTSALAGLDRGELLAVSDPPLWCNRAAAWFKTGKFRECLDVCDSVSARATTWEPGSAFLWDVV
ncbi:MAG: hypothetical protein HQ453_04950 [Actinobacteria bacterium]|nr:hypothetical protein [Actinomycetota bacterium]